MTKTKKKYISVPSGYTTQSCCFNCKFAMEKKRKNKSSVYYCTFYDTLGEDFSSYEYPTVSGIGICNHYEFGIVSYYRRR